MPSVGKVGQPLVLLPEELGSAVANCVDSQDELSSQLRRTTAQISEQNTDSMLNFVIFTEALYKCKVIKKVSRFVKKHAVHFKLMSQGDFMTNSATASLEIFWTRLA